MAASEYLPTTISSADDAVRDGALELRDLPLCSAESVHVADYNCWEMALSAARRAMSGTPVEPIQLGMMTYSAMSTTTEEPWSPAHRVARILGAEQAVTLTVSQMSNGGTAALQIAASTLTLESQVDYAMAITAADFTSLPFHRWAKAPGVTCGDGAQAVLLARGHDSGLSLRAIATVGDSGLEATFPAEHPFRIENSRHRHDPGFADNALRIRAAVAEAVTRCLDDADIAADDPRFVAVYPTRLGELAYRLCVRPALPRALRNCGVVLGSTTGHLGSGDSLSNMAHIAANPHKAGDLALLISTGAGFTASCMLVEQLP